MRIVHVVDSMEMGGAEILVALLCRWQRSEGHNPSVCCLIGGGALANQLEQEGIRVCVHRPTSGRLGRMRMMRSLYKEFALEHPDVVHCHNMSPTILASLPARWAGVRAVFSTRHGMANRYSITPKSGGSTARVGGLLRFCLAATYCSRVVAVCDAARRNLETGLGSSLYKVVTIRNGVLPMSPSLSPDPSIRKVGFTLISVARLNWKKNQACLLRAVALARKQVQDLHLWLVGGGPETESLQDLARQLKIESCVRFAGERGDIGDWLAQADLFVLSSLTEGLPLSLLEAMAASLPFVVTNVGGMPEVAELSGAGTVVESNSVEALSEAIVRHASHREELPELGRRARLCYEQHFTLEQMVNSYSGLYQECLRSGA